MPEYWSGSGANPSGSTPFGYYDDDSKFQTLAPKVASWVAISLGYPTVQVELADTEMYAFLEEAITEYAAQVNQFRIRDNLLDFLGAPTSSNVNDWVGSNSMGLAIKLSEQYGTIIGVGGNVDWKRGYITTVADQQEYDLATLFTESTDIEVKRVFHDHQPAITRYFDPFLTAGLGTPGYAGSVGLDGMMGGLQYTMMPLYEDILRLQAIEFSQVVRKSAYTFELINNKLKLFPVPSTEFNVWFEYVDKSERIAAGMVTGPSGSVEGSTINNVSNIPYNNFTFTEINDPGLQWIRKYTLALSKRGLGTRRSKFANMPIPGAEIQLDGDALKQEGTQEIENLLAELREMLEQTSRKTQLENKAAEAEAHQELLKKSPLGFWVM